MVQAKVKVISDSTSDIPEEFLKKYDIEIVPVYIHYKDNSYADGRDITVDEFYEMLRNTKDLPKTSGSNPQDFLEKIQESLKNYSSVIITTLSAKLSTTYQSAKLAVKRIKEKKVHVIDSRFGSGVAALLTIGAAKLAKRGLDEDEIVKRVEEIRDQSILLGYVDNIENLKKSGRISHFKYFVANLLNAKPIIELRDGILQPLTKAKGKIKAQKKVVVEILKRVKKKEKYDLMITHGDDLESAKVIMEELEKKLNLGEKIINYITPALAVHLGIGTIVVSLSPSP
ncbi:MAG: DegV family protein [Candidatus Heimdallarchaeaceae archaeon]